MRTHRHVFVTLVILLLSARFVTAQTTDVSDTYTDTNGTLITSHTPNVDVSGAGWQNDLNAPQFVIQSNKIVMATAFGSQIYTTVDSQHADITLTTDITVPGASTYIQGVLFRFTDTSNYWQTFLRYDGGSPYIQMVAVCGGSAVVNDSSTTISLAGGATTTLTITTSGNTVTAAVTGGEHGSWTNSCQNTATRVGITGYTDGSYAAGTWDNFLVTHTSGGGATTPRGTLVGVLP